MQRHGRKDRLLKERRHDSYQVRSKLPEPTLCDDCGALYVGGRWCWKEPPEETNKTTCPACRRIADNFPAGHIEIKGAFFLDHRDEIFNLIRNLEEREKEERPLERIMAISEKPEEVMVTTTGIHLARRIGEALSRSYSGDLSFQYGDAEQRIRVFWQR